MNDYFAPLGCPQGPTKIFEKLSVYVEKNSRPGYWGEVTSSIDWCEHNYEVSFYVAEWWNTLSNVVLLLLGVWGLFRCAVDRLETRFWMVYGGISIIGVGSILFHGTLSFLGQQGDETPMIYTILSWSYCLIWMCPQRERQHRLWFRATGWGFTLFCAVFTVVHYYVSFVLVFQLLFGSICAFTIYSLIKEIARCRVKRAARLGKLYIIATIIGFTLWMLDTHHCETLYDLPGAIPNPQFHAWWHICVAIACYVGPTFLVFQREAALNRTPHISFTLFGFLPYVTVRN